MSRSYQQTGSYIPETDWGVCQWLRNFSARISENPGRYFLTKADADLVADTYRQYREAFDLVQDPHTRTAPNVAAKDAQRASAIATIRPIAQIVRAKQAMSNEDLINLGLSPRNTSRTPHDAPASAPIIAVKAVFAGEHQLVYCDENTPSSRRKPFGVNALRLSWRVLEPGEQLTPKTLDPKTFHHTHGFTRTPFKVEHAPEDAGKTVVYYARWATRTGKMGPWSSPVYFTIANGGSVWDRINAQTLAEKMKNPVQGDGDGGSASTVKMAA